VQWSSSAPTSRVFQRPQRCDCLSCHQPGEAKAPQRAAQPSLFAARVCAALCAEREPRTIVPHRHANGRRRWAPRCEATQLRKLHCPRGLDERSHSPATRASSATEGGDERVGAKRRYPFELQRREPDRMAGTSPRLAATHDDGSKARPARSRRGVRQRSTCNARGKTRVAATDAHARR
jgi:hypothetical protein